MNLLIAEGGEEVGHGSSYLVEIYGPIQMPIPAEVFITQDGPFRDSGLRLRKHRQGKKGQSPSSPARPTPCKRSMAWIPSWFLQGIHHGPHGTTCVTVLVVQNHGIHGMENGGHPPSIT
jgi:hypothetical protein